MDILKAFVLNGTSYDVNILWEEDCPLFRATDIAKILDLKCIYTSIAKFTDKHKALRKLQTLGGPQETTFLTERGLYKLLMQSRKPIAEPFQDWVEDVIVSIRKTGKYELELKEREFEQTLQEKIGAAIAEEAEKHKLLLIQAKHESLRLAFRGPNRRVVYFGLIKQISGKFLIKIGSTKDVFNRANELATEFGSFYLFHVIDCPSNEDFECFLHKHHMIEPHAYREPIAENKTSHEVFLVSEETRDQIIDIARRNAFKFTDKITAQQTIELENLKLQKLETRVQLKEIERQIVELFGNGASTSEEVQTDPVEEEDQGDDDPIIITNDRKTTVARGPKYQIYTLDGKLVKTFSCLIEPIRKNEYLPEASRNRIQSAVKNNVPYKNYRWMTLDRNLPDDTVQKLPPEGDGTSLNKGYVAMLNFEKTSIEKVFRDQKELVESGWYSGGAGISKAISRGSESRGKYFMMWFSCSDELKQDYLNRETLPEKRVSTNAKPVEQLHPTTGKILKKYASIADVIREHKASRKTIESAIEHKYAVKGYKWRYSPNGSE